MSDESVKFSEELEALLKKFPEMAKGFTVEAAEEKAAVSKPVAAAERRCIRYGVDPQTGKIVCLQYE